MYQLSKDLKRVRHTHEVGFSMVELANIVVCQALDIDMIYERKTLSFSSSDCHAAFIEINLG
jgi:hypothetical protein